MVASLKQKIFSTAQEMFLQNGVRVVTIDDLCRALAISKKTFYQFYTNKEELVSDVLKKDVNEKFSSLSDVLSTEPMDAIYNLGEILCKYKPSANLRLMNEIGKYYREISDDVYRTLGQKFVDLLDAFYDQGHAEGIFRPDLDMATVTALIGLLHKAIVQAEINGEIDTKILPEKTIFAAFWFIARHAILSEEGERLYQQKCLDMQKKNN